MGKKRGRERPIKNEGQAIKVSVANRQERLELPPAWLRDITRTVLEGEGVSRAKIGVALMTDDAIHEVNRRFLRHDEPTDVITFPMSNPGAKTLEAEILISTDTAAAVAAEKRHSAQDEVALYLIHGLLHLCGFDDHEDSDRLAMRGLEAKYLSKLGIKLSDYPSA
jgi:probable rRNA maturation factor